MSLRTNWGWGTLLAVIGLVCVIAGGILMRLPPVAEARLVVTVQANPSSETFPGIVDGASRIAATLVEVAALDSFRDEVLESGFSGMQKPSADRLEKLRRAWRDRVTVRRLGESLALRVRVTGDTREESVALAGAVVHALALRAPTLVGNHILRAQVERMPSLVRPLGSEPVAFALVGAGAALGVLGVVFSLMLVHATAVQDRTRARVGPAVVAAPAAEPAAPNDHRLSPEDARYWLQKFLEEHQRTPRRRPEEADITTWEDVPEPARETR